MKLNFIGRLFLPLSFLVFCSSGCRKEVSYDELPTPIEVGLHEIFHQGERFFALSFITRESYPCENFEIINTVHNTSHGIDIEFLGLHVPSNCMANVGPARGKAKLSPMEPSDLALSFNYGSKSQSSQVSISQQDLTVFPLQNDQTLLFFRDLKMKRIPSDYIWGIISDKQENDDTLPDDLINQLLEEGARIIELPDDHYGFFRIVNSVVYTDPYMIEENENIDSCLTFVMEWDGEFQVVEQIASHLDNELHISIFSAKGDEFVNQ